MGQAHLATAQPTGPFGPRLKQGSLEALDDELVTCLMYKFRQILQVDRLEHKEQLYFLDQVQNPKGLQVINSGINSNLNLS
jgi:hypothetical protein